jgi:hypothetical protein
VVKLRKHFKLIFIFKNRLIKIHETTVLKQTKRMQIQLKKRILIAPLNWGLGHAARCIPIIKALQEQQFEPVIASDGIALLLLRKEF